MDEQKKKHDSSAVKIKPVYHFMLAASLSFFGGFVFIIVYLFFNTPESPAVIVSNVASWFDPVYFKYNLLLLAFSVLIVPCITILYVHDMKKEKKQRLKNEMSRNDWDKQKHYVSLQLDKMFHIRNYIGSVTTQSAIIMFGASIILLLKPQQIGTNSGLDYNQGANFLMLATYMKLFIRESHDYMGTLINSLTAFQFGFLGAYVHFIAYLIRSYFTLDLAPNTFIVSSVRMVVGCLVALVVSFILPDIPGFKGEQPLFDLNAWLPVLAFSIGFFPSRGLLFLEKLSTKALNIKRKRYQSMPLSELPGMSFSHEIRLEREGFDNLENFIHADTLELAIRTGFLYGQLMKWQDQAQMAAHMGEDYREFRHRTGISSMSEMASYLTTCKSSDPNVDPGMELIHAMGDKIDAKLHIIGQLALCIGHKKGDGVK